MDFSLSKKNAVFALFWYSTTSSIYLEFWITDTESKFVVVNLIKWNLFDNI